MRRRAAVSLAVLALVFAAASARAQEAPDRCPAPAERPRIEVVSPGSPFVDEQDTCGFGDDRRRYTGGTCGLDGSHYGPTLDDGLAGQDSVYRVRLNRSPELDNRVGFRLEPLTPGADLVLVLVRECEGEGSCVDHSPDFIGPGTEEIPTQARDPGIYHLFVDSATYEVPGRCGRYRLTAFGVNPTPDLQVSLTAPGEAVAGTPLTYTLTVTNQGTLDATDVTAEVTLPEGTTLADAGDCRAAGARRVVCEIDSLARGGSGFTGEIGVLVSPSARGRLEARARAHAVEGGQDLADCEDDPSGPRHCATRTTPVRAETDLELTAEASGSPAVAGCPLLYAHTVVNHGPSQATGVEVADVLPGLVAFPADDEPALGCPARAEPPSGCLGGCRRTPDRTGVVCPIPPLAPGDRRQVCIPVTVRPSAGDPTNGTGSLIHRADVRPGPGETDPNLSQNFVQLTTSVSRWTDLEISKRALDPDEETEASSVIAGEELTYKVEVVNHGPSDSSGGKVRDRLPRYLRLGSDGASSGCELEGNLRTCPVGELSVGESQTLTYRVHVEPSRRQDVQAGARVIANESDRRPENDRAPTTTQVDVEADLVLCNLAPREVFRGAQALFRVQIRNAGGPSDWPGGEGEVVLGLPEGTTLVSSPDDCDHGGGEGVRCTIPRVRKDGTRELRFVLAVDPEADAPLVTAPVIEPPGGDDSPRDTPGDHDAICEDVQEEGDSTQATSTVLDGPDLVLPYFTVRRGEAGTEAGSTTTLLAVQNIAEEPAVVRYDYFNHLGTPLALEEAPALPAHGVRTVNLRDVAGLSSAGETATGYAWITWVEPSFNLADATISGPLAGDFLRLNLDPSSVDGSLLVSADRERRPPELCRRWATRSQDSPPFDGGTDFVFWLREDLEPPPDAPMGPADGADRESELRVVQGRVFGADGSGAGEVTITTFANAFVRNSREEFDDVPLPVSTGSVEWQLPEGFVGHVSTVFRSASGDAAVAVPGVCLDQDATVPREPGREHPLVLPYFEVGDGDRATELTVRNDGAEQVSIEIRHFPPEGGEATLMDAELQPHALQTIDLQNAPGYVEIQASGDQPISEPVSLSGDYVRLGPGDQAAGGALIDRDPDLDPPMLCQKWATRILHSGVSLSTAFVIHAPNEPGGDGENGPLEAILRTIEGACLPAVQDSEPCIPLDLDLEDVASEVSSGDLLRRLPIDTLFGSIEWTFPEGRPGHVSMLLRADGGYSVLIPGTCLDPPGDP